MLQAFSELYFTVTTSLIASRPKTFSLFEKNNLKREPPPKTLYLAEKNFHVE